jgi:Ca-activated chloride channel family protein
MEFAKSRRVNLEMHYKGSVDIMNDLRSGTGGYDAVWPANSLWIAMGDTERRVKRVVSVMQSPVAFGIRESLAADLGFEGEVRVADLLKAIESRRLRFMMTSATQSNSGASAYFGFLYALAGNPEVLEFKHLDDPVIREDVRTLLSGIERSSGSSGWLKDLFLSSDYDAMVNYESVLIETNLALEASGREQLRIVYPADGTVIADSPLGLVSSGDSKKETFFRELTEHLLSTEIQARLVSEGRRPAYSGTVDLDPAVFRKEWGIDPRRSFAAIRIPGADVIEKALILYQTEYRKPSYTIFCLDYSGSMEGSGEAALEEAMALLLDRDKAAEYMIQTGTEDRIAVIPFSTKPLGILRAEGSDPVSQSKLSEAVLALDSGGGTDIYSPVIKALEILAAEPNLDQYVPAVVLMTDGESNTGRSYRDLAEVWSNTGLDIPVFSIAFGGADNDQLEPIAELTRARVFDGRKDLAKTFRTVKGYN